MEGEIPKVIDNPNRKSLKIYSENTWKHFYTSRDKAHYNNYFHRTKKEMTCEICGRIVTCQLNSRKKTNVCKAAAMAKELEELKTSKTNFDNVKHQVDHLDTFRNELIKEREEHQKTRDSYEEKIKELNDKIDYLQLTPAKRKKIDEANKVSEAKTLIDITEDGGLF